ncbi:LysR family transcriptional regulator [Rhodospirillum sp. A1_3_36]|uniref:LysR family transcriptional regulator n=1 Tax=Rhodospirillum sp. A1_3_36 TaxID=3391666 RepID=UPI0039A5758D
MTGEASTEGLSGPRIRAFNAVVRQRSFSRAAQVLGISQPAVTAQIRKLESAFGVVLFERTAAGAETTDLGLRLFALTQQIDDVEAAAQALLEAGAMAPRELRIATPSPQICMPLVAGFIESFPTVRVSVVLGSTGEARTRLLERQVDVGLLHLDTPDERLSSQPFRRQRLMALLPAAHPLANDAAVSMANLVKKPMVLRSGPSLTQAMADRALAKAELAVTPALWLETREGAHEAVANGIGAGFVLDNDTIPDPRVKPVPLIDADEEIWESIVWLRARQNQPAIRAFVRLAARMTHGVEV